jgi:hypothetical protein
MRTDGQGGLCTWSGSTATTTSALVSYTSEQFVHWSTATVHSVLTQRCVAAESKRSVIALKPAVGTISAMHCHDSHPTCNTGSGAQCTVSSAVVVLRAVLYAYTQQVA